jgi:ubiquinone/menaquinone biosynthesis C-methylase UbiE
MLRAPWITQSIHVAAKLGLADLIKDGAQPVEALAQATATDALSLYRLLRLLASVGIFVEGAEKCFGLTPLATPLRSDVPGSLRALAAIYGEGMFWQPWGNILHTIQTGETAFEHVFGKNIYAYLAETPALATLFDQAMSGLVAQVAEAVAIAYDFSPFRHIVDVGGGKGVLVTAVLKQYPQLTATLLDLPQVIAYARQPIEVAGLADRCGLVSGDFFQAVPAGGDVYLLSTIICNWDDGHATTILKNCRRAMAQESKLLLVEIVIPPGNIPSPGKLLDLQMMMITGGRDRTAAEYRALLAAAGFTMTQVIATASERSIIEAIPTA